MGKIVAIGGVNPPSNLDSIDKEIIMLTNKENPKVLYIPTAGGDNLGYCEFFKEIYKGKFGCHVDVLLLVKETPKESEIRERVFSVDIIYVEGGEVKRLMDYFQKYNMHEILKEAYEKGIVLAGKSAGAICWGVHWLDTETFDFNIEGYKDYTKVDCLNFVEFLLCPHYNLDGYSEKLDDMVKEFNLVGIGLDNNCAIEIVDNTYKVISTNMNENAFRVYKVGSKIIRKVITKDSNFRFINELNGQ